MSGLPVFLVGGGAASQAHRRLTLDLDSWLRRFIPHGLGAKIQALPVPDGLSFESRAEEAHRLAVAFGLSFPTDDIPQARLPSSIDDDLPLAPKTSAYNFITKDMV